jgi:hypothetical protein
MTDEEKYTYERTIDVVILDYVEREQPARNAGIRNAILKNIRSKWALDSLGAAGVNVYSYLGLRLQALKSHKKVAFVGGADRGWVIPAGPPGHHFNPIQPES